MMPTVFRYTAMHTGAPFTATHTPGYLFTPLAVCMQAAMYPAGILPPGAATTTVTRTVSTESPARRVIIMATDLMCARPRMGAFMPTAAML